MAKARKLMGLFTVLLASMLLVACGQKTTKDGVPTILQDKYSGYSKVYGTDGPFSEGGVNLLLTRKRTLLLIFQVMTEKMFIIIKWFLKIN